MNAKLGPGRLGLGIFSLLLIILSWWQVLRVNEGLVTRSLTRDGVPLRYLAPADAENMPGVLVAHGFSGSKQLMYGFGYALAHAGYGVMLWDFGGHGANPGTLDREGGTLQQNLDTAYAALVEQPGIDPARVSLLGHSMGSGAVMTAGVANVDRYAATVAVSPTGADVSPTAPRNFLLMAGLLEPPFLANARDLLAQAGGPGEDFAAGTARALVEVPSAEHITILFRWLSHATAVDWLDRTFGVQPGARPYQDVRMLWYAAHLLGWLGLVTAVAPLIPRPSATLDSRRTPWHWLGLLLAPFIASGLLALLSRFADVSQLGGLLVGGTLGLWFFVAGLIWLLAGFRVPLPGVCPVLWGLLLFAVLWLAFGALGQLVWLQWLLIPARLWRWLLLALAFLPVMLAAGLAQQDATAGRRVLWWLAQSVFLIAGLGLAIVLVPSFFFVALILPLLPLILGVIALAGAAFGSPWSYAVGSALFFAWLVVAVFPLAAG